MLSSSHDAKLFEFGSTDNPTKKQYRYILSVNGLSSEDRQNSKVEAVLSYGH